MPDPFALSVPGFWNFSKISFLLSRKVSKFVLNSALLAVLFFINSGCKKGEDDPVFSFRTRKARLEGEWRLQSGTVMITTVDFAQAARLNDIFQLRDSRFTLTETGQGNTANAFIGAFLLNVTFTKDGAFNMYEHFGSGTLEASGTWEFNQRSAGKKSKEYVNLKINKVISGKTSGYFLFNQSSVAFTYRIKELRNKKLVLVVESDIYVDANGLEQSYKGEYTFIQ